MKKLFFAIIILGSMYATAQDDYMIKKDGTKIQIKNQDFHYSTFGKLRYYLASNNGIQAQKGIELDEIEKLISGEITYLPFKESEKSNANLLLYKVVAESNDKTLLLAFDPPRANDDYYLFYQYRIVDKSTNTIIESGTFVESGLRKKLEIQKTAIEAVKKHFSNCKNIIDNLAGFEKKLPTNNGMRYTDIYIAGFMHQKKLLKCE